MAMQRAMSRAISIIIVICPLLAFGQVTNVTDETSTPIPGAGHDYLHAFSETVNPANGSVSLRLSVPVPPGRSLSLPFSFDYDSNGVYALTSLALGQASYSTTYQGYFYSGGWGYAFPTLSYANVTVPDTDKPTNTCTAGMDYVFTSPTGSRHSLGIGISFTPSNLGCPSTSGNRLSGGDSVYHADVENSGNGPLYVHDHDGTQYYFERSGGCGGTPKLQLPYQVEDRNGNIISYSTDPNCTQAISMTDTAGRPAVVTSGFGATGNTVTISGFAQPFKLTWASVSAQFSMGWNFETQPPSGLDCGVSMAGSSLNVVTAITLPNGHAYQFSYNDPYGLLSQITYPDGGYVQYQWTTNSSSEYGQFVGANTSQVGSPTPGGLCTIIYGTPAIQHRYVSFDGSTVAQQEDFSYSTCWVGSSCSNPLCGSAESGWICKTTTVTTHDLVAKKTYTTTYTYTSVAAPGQPQFVFPNYAFAAQIPVEQNVVYGDYSGSTAETVTESWLDPYLQHSEQITLGTSGPTSNTVYSYTSGELQEKDEYDYGNTSSTPTRKTVINYQPFSTYPSYLTYSSIIDRQCQYIVYDNAGKSAAETDYLYDRGTAVCGTAGTPSVGSVSGLPTGTHDETYYGPSASIARGNVTTMIKKCFLGCSDATVSYAYDETGQPTSMTDPCGNGTCSDMGDTGHTTTYSYTDSPSGGNSYGNSNAYLTSVTEPPTNGVAHVRSFTYNYAAGELASSTAENNKTTDYSYNTKPQNCSSQDTLDRLGEIDYPDGGKVTYCYNDSPASASSPSVTTSELQNSSNALKTSVAIRDGMGHVVETQLTSESQLETVNYVYDGMDEVASVSNPYRSSPAPGDPPQGTISYTYDSLGRKVSETMQDGSVSIWCYDGVPSVLPSGAKSNCGSDLGSQNTGTWVDFTDGRGGHWQQTSDSFGRLSEVMEPDPVAGSPSLETDYQYNVLDDLIAVVQRGGAGDTPRTTRSFTYDSLSQLVCSSNPENSGAQCPIQPSGSYVAGTTGYSYDLNGNLYQKQSLQPSSLIGSGQTITINYNYDALNRLIGKTYSGAPAGTLSSCYAYDTATFGNPYLANLWTIAGSCSRTPPSSGYQTMRSISAYDAMGRISSEKQCTPTNCSGSNQYSLSYDYDLAGHVTQYVNGVGSIMFNPSYDSTGTVQNITSTWNPDAPNVFTVNAHNMIGLTNWTMGSGPRVQKDYTQRLQVQSISATGNTIQNTP